MFKKIICFNYSLYSHSMVDADVSELGAERGDVRRLVIIIVSTECGIEPLNDDVEREALFGDAL